MTLTTRLTAFYLGTLAVVLIAFSGALYLLAHRHLHAELHDRTSGILDTVMARAEIDPEGVEWEPKLAKPSLSRDIDSPYWAVFGPHGERLDGGGGLLLSIFGERPIPGAHGIVTDLSRQEWFVVRQSIHHPDEEMLPPTLEPNRYTSLTFVAALPTEPVQRTLRTLAWSLFVVTLSVWLSAAGAARWICRRALHPVATMAVEARSITPENLGERLPVPTAQDELRDLALAFNGLLARFQDSFERQERFTAEASHQLRTPLTALRGQIDVALRRDRDPDAYRSALATIGAQAVRMHEIVESLLFLARADADARRPELKRIDLRTWLPDYLSESWGAHTRYRDILLHPPTSVIPPVEVHPVLLGQALGNLLENALKFGPPGSVVDVRVTPRDGAVSLEVEDRGCGIAEADRPHIFEPFFRTESARTTGKTGVGLGLAITARIVAAMGGQIFWTSSDGGGSRFRMAFPGQPRETSTAD